MDNRCSMQCPPDAWHIITHDPLDKKLMVESTIYLVSIIATFLPFGNDFYTVMVFFNDVCLVCRHPDNISAVVDKYTFKIQTGKSTSSTSIYSSIKWICEDEMNF